MRPRWKGTLSIGLVHVPVHLYTSVDRDTKPTGHHVHRTCQTQLKTKKWCPVCETEVADDGELMRGFDVPGYQGFVELTDDELATLKVEATKTIVIERIAPVSELDPLLVTDTFYLTGDGTATAAEAEAVLIAAMAGKVGIGTLVLNQRERRVALMVYNGQFVLQSLRSAAAVREMPRSVLPPVDPQVLALAGQLVTMLEGPLDLESTRDAYADGMWALLKAKAAGQALPEPVPEAPAPKAVGLKDALLAALAAAKAPAAPAPPPVQTPQVELPAKVAKAAKASMRVVKGKKTGTQG